MSESAGLGWYQEFVSKKFPDAACLGPHVTNHWFSLGDGW